MLKFRIKHEDAAPEPKPLTLELAHYHDGVVVRVADAECGSLIVIKRDGTIHRLPRVDSSLGFQRDSFGRVIISNPL